MILYLKEESHNTILHRAAFKGAEMAEEEDAGVEDVDNDHDEHDL